MSVGSGIRLLLVGFVLRFFLGFFVRRAVPLCVMLGQSFRADSALQISNAFDREICGLFRMVLRCFEWNVKVAEWG